MAWHTYRRDIGTYPFLHFHQDKNKTRQDNSLYYVFGVDVKNNGVVKQRRFVFIVLPLPYAFHLQTFPHTIPGDINQPATHYLQPFGAAAKAWRRPAWRIQRCALLLRSSTTTS